VEPALETKARFTHAHVSVWPAAALRRSLGVDCTGGWRVGHTPPRHISPAYNCLNINKLTRPNPTKPNLNLKLII